MAHYDDTAGAMMSVLGGAQMRREIREMNEDEVGLLHGAGLSPAPGFRAEPGPHWGG